MSNNIRSLFPDTLVSPTTVSPAQMLQENILKASESQKALVITIQEQQGVWNVSWDAAGMTNSESLMALEVIQREIMDTVLGR